MRRRSCVIRPGANSLGRQQRVVSGPLVEAIDELIRVRCFASADWSVGEVGRFAENPLTGAGHGVVFVGSPLSRVARHRTPVRKAGDVGMMPKASSSIRIRRCAPGVGCWAMR
jgi:hypothetical protein